MGITIMPIHCLDWCPWRFTAAERELMCNSVHTYEMYVYCVMCNSVHTYESMFTCAAVIFSEVIKHNTKSHNTALETQTDQEMQWGYLFMCLFVYLCVHFIFSLKLSTLTHALTQEWSGNLRSVCVCIEPPGTGLYTSVVSCPNTNFVPGAWMI